MAGLLRPRTITNLARVRASGQQSVIDLFTDAWVLWERARPDGTWDDGTTGERWRARLASSGKLFSNQAGGAGGPQIGDGLIYADSPYRLRVAAAGWGSFQAIDKSAPDLSKYSLVLNGNRLFRLDVVKFDDDDDLLADVFLTELFGQKLPAEGML